MIHYLRSYMARRARPKTPEQLLDEALAARKAVRIVEQERARKAYWKQEREQHARDPELKRAGLI